MEAFVAIVRRGGFTRASAALHLSQPAISRRVHLLERELGAPTTTNTLLDELEAKPVGVKITEGRSQNQLRRPRGSRGGSCRNVA